MKASIINSKEKHGLKRFILVISACVVMLAAVSGVNAASCIDLADIPLDAMEQAAPGLIMFVLDDFFMERYRHMVQAVHDCGWHFFLHSCGRINDFVPHFMDADVDVLNMQQPQAYGIEELGRRFGGKICFLTTADIQATMPSGDLDAVRAEVRQLVEHWSTPKGGLIVFNYGMEDAIGTTVEATEVMFEEFDNLKHHWS